MTRVEAIDQLRAAVVGAKKAGLQAYEIVDTVAEGFYDGNDLGTAAAMQVVAARLQPASNARDLETVPLA